MKLSNKMLLFDVKSKSLHFVIRYTVSSFIVFLSAFILLKFPEFSFAGVQNGIEICANNLIPSLYPFMILSNMFVSLTTDKKRNTNPSFFEKMFTYIFKLPSNCAFVIFFSFIGGLPVGAIMSEHLYDRGIISKDQWGRMLCFCINPGPAFVISSVGLNMLGSKKTGVILYLSLIVSSIILGVFTRFFASENEIYKYNSYAEKTVSKKGSVIENAVVKSSKSLLIICAWVVAFSCAVELVVNLNLPYELKNFILCTAEMTKGCMNASEHYPVPVIAAVIGFSGFCGHFQLMWAIDKSETKYKYFIVGRIINSGLSAAICGLLLKVFPIARETFSVGTVPENKEMSGSVVLSLLMIFMAILFVLGDDYKAVRKKS